MHRKKLVLITDIDNTLFDWFEMWYSSFTYLLDQVTIYSKSDREAVLDEIKTIHQIYGTSEYHFLLDKIKIVKSFDPFVVDQIRKNYYRIRNENMVLYPGVRETLTKLKAKGVRIVAFSESKKYYSAYRLSRLNVSDLIDRLYCPEDHRIENNIENFETFDEDKIVCLPEQFKKPNPLILKEIIKDENAYEKDCLYIGDSKSKDIKMAQRANVDSVWFAYGASHLIQRSQDYDLLKRVTHWNEKAVLDERNQLSPSATLLDIPPDRVVNKYNEILKFF